MRAVVTLLPEEEEAEHILSRMGLHVHRVPTTSLRKTPEFLVDGDGRGYVVEVKARADSEGWREALDRGGVAEQQRSMGYGRWTEDVARAALKQMAAADPQHRRWWILWLPISCEASPDSMMDEIIGSLFGVRQVVDLAEQRSDQALTMRLVLFALPGVFERHPEIVGVITCTGETISFCVNDEFAPDFATFQQSRIYTVFARRSPPNSARQLREAGFLSIADRSVDRRNEKALQCYLTEAHGIEKPVLLDMKHYTATMMVPHDHAPSIRDADGG